MQEDKDYDYINPDHYKTYSIEAIEMMERVWGIDSVISYCEMCSFKYRMRLGNKPDQPIERDLEKARWYEDYAKKLKSKMRLINLSDISHKHEQQKSWSKTTSGQDVSY